MPELPEVETIRSDLEKSVLGRRVLAAQVIEASLVRAPSAAEFAAGLQGRTIRAADRRGKYLLLRLDDGRTWAMHLSLEGRLLLVAGDTPVRDGTKLAVTLDDATELRFWDKVSYATTALGDEAALNAVYHLDLLGPEPVDEGFTEAVLRQRIGGRRSMIKPLLLDQRNIAGVGNIYVDEALWRAYVHPVRKASTLTDAEWAALHHALVHVMNEGVAHRGTSAPGGLYRDLHGEKGGHQAHLAVFRHAGRPCPRCENIIQRTEVGGRSTFFCPTCQRVEEEADAPAKPAKAAKRSHPARAARG